MILSPDTGAGPDGFKAAFKRLVDDINRFHPTIAALPTFVDDAAAAAGRLKVGAAYVDTNGFVRRRVA